MKVFVTYASDKGNPAYGDYIQRFVNYLRREEGYDAYMDRFLSQKETAIDFIKMMHKGMTDYEKVIVFLSPLYKQRAEAFIRGVGNEYSLIIRDIENNPSKYILVTNFGKDDDIFPLSFKGREVIELSEPIQEDELNKLRAKLNDEPIYIADEVAKVRKPVVAHQPERTSFAQESHSANILIRDFTVRFDSSHGGVWIEYYLQANIQNVGQKVFTELSIEISIPVELCSQILHEEKAAVNFRVEDENCIITYGIDRKLFPKQSFSTAPLPVKIWLSGSDTLLDKSVIVTVYTDDGSIVKEVLVSDLLYNGSNGMREPLSRDDFNARY